MRACVIHKAGDLRVEEWDPGLPGPGEILVAVTLGGICGSDLHYYHRGAVGDFQVSLRRSCSTWTANDRPRGMASR